MKLNDMHFYKYFMLLFNMIIIAMGAMTIIMSLAITHGQRMEYEQQQSISRGLLAFLITLSLFLIVTAVLGCIGALKQHIRTLYVHVCFYIFLICIEMIVGIGAVLVHAWAASNHDLRVSFYKNTTMEEDAAKIQVLDRIQIKSLCCGIDGPHDYAVIHREIPASCCPSAHPLREGSAKRQLHTICLNDRTYFMKGCEGALKSEKLNEKKVVAGLTAILLFLEISLVVISLSMVKHIRQGRRQLQQNLQAHFES